MSEALIECHDLVVGHDGRPLLPPISLTIRRGDFVAVLGRNGAGKSTWLKTVLRLIPPISGHTTRGVAARLAYVPQVGALDDVVPVRAAEVVLWGSLEGWGFLRPFASRADRTSRDQALDAAQAQEFARRPYRDLSQGQKQRILFARMLALRADVAILDEPTAAMDALAEREALDRLAALASTRSMAIVIVAHDPGVAAEFADRVLFLDRDDQAVVTGDTEAVFADPRFRRHYGEARRRHAG